MRNTTEKATVGRKHLYCTDVQSWCRLAGSATLATQGAAVGMFPSPDDARNQHTGWCLSPPTSNVGLNFSTTLHLQNSAMHMGHTWANLRFFRIAYLGCTLMGPNSNNPPPDLKFPFRDFAKPLFLFIYQCFSKDC